jgi:UDP-2,4-diacetamido-2,4,6-trideoxy-beta-L-altropyranose hydrolase
VEAVLLTFGGGDDRGMTLRALGWLEMGGFGGRVEVLTTKLNPQVDALKAYAQGLGGRIRIHVDNWRPESLMARCQLSITGGGTTLHELACLGVPALVVSLAENQTAPGQAWETAGLGAFLGQAQDLDDQEAVRTVRRFLGDEALRLAVASRCLQVQDGLGAGRVAEALVAWVR